MNLADLLTTQAVRTPQATAVIHGERVFSYAAFEALVWGLCQRLHDEGLRPGDVAGLQLTDPLLHLASVLALARLGVTSVAVATTGENTEAGQQLLARTAAKAVLEGQRGRDWGGLPVITLELAAVCAIAADADEQLRCAQPVGPLHFKTSSGTTAAPKLVAASHAGMVASIERELASIGYPAGERYMTPVSMSHDGPRRRYLACLAGGGTAVMPPTPGGAAALLQSIERHDVRHFSCVPSQAYELAAAVAPGRPRFPQMRVLRLSAGPSEASLHRLLRERLTPQVLISYGCTELGPMAVAPPELVARHPNTVGRTMPGISVQIVSADGQMLPPEQVGLIRVRAEGMPQAYHDDPSASAQFFKDGWFYPGDLGKISTEGLLFHMGRADSMMLMDGINIYPAAIEQVLLSHGAVRDAVALPLRHRVTHDVPVCAVALHEGQPSSETELMAFARSKLGAHRPRRVFILDAIPRNEHGKVQRTALTRRLMQQLAAERGPQAATADAVSAPLGQLQLVARLQFMVPEGLEFARLDAWLQGALQLAPPAPPDSSAEQAGAEPQARAWLQRLLLLMRTLLQAARVPVFDAPQALHCSVDPAGGRAWQARVALARVDEMSSSAYGLAFKAAEQLARWALVHGFDGAQLQAFYAVMQEQLDGDLGRMMPAGHSRMPVLRAAHRSGIPFTHLGAGVFQLGWGQHARRLDRSVSDADSAIGGKLCANKATAAALLRASGLPAPSHAVVTSGAQALKAAQQLGWPVVVKPSDLERGEGVVVDVADDATLQAAFTAAQALSRSKTVIVERQVPGVCHRLFIAQGRLLYAVKRLPMSVQGDGVADIDGLVAAECARQLQLPPWERSGLQPLDALALAALARAGLTPRSVPARGAWVALRRIESTAWGGVDEEVTQQIHPENLRVALAAAERFGLDMAGIDIISSDITQPWHDNGAIINEVNYAPLLGGAAISRSHLPAFLANFVPGRGTLPVDVFVGGAAAWSAATQRWQERLAAGTAAYLSDARRTLQPDGQPWPMPIVGLYARTRALVLCPQAQALVLVVHSDELMQRGLPLEAVSSVTVIDAQLVSARPPGLALASDRVHALLRHVQGWPRLAAAVEAASP
jgi:cyanophycin synthetase